MFAICDVNNFFTSNLELYCGKQKERQYKFENSGHAIVKRLIRPISKTGRNITCTNWFTSILLCQDLLKNDKLTMVVTLMRIRREIPLILASAKDRPLLSNAFAFLKVITILS